MMSMYSLSRTSTPACEPTPGSPSGIRPTQKLNQFCEQLEVQCTQAQATFHDWAPVSVLKLLGGLFNNLCPTSSASSCPYRQIETISKELGSKDPSVIITEMIRRHTMNSKMPCEFDWLRTKFYDLVDISELALERWPSVEVPLYLQNSCFNPLTLFNESNTTVETEQTADVGREMVYQDPETQGQEHASSIQPYATTLGSVLPINSALECHKECINNQQYHGAMEVTEPSPLESAFDVMHISILESRNKNPDRQSNQLLTVPDMGPADDSESDDGDYWAWNQEKQKFEHWDEEDGQWVYCPDDFD